MLFIRSGRARYSRPTVPYSEARLARTYLWPFNWYYSGKQLTCIHSRSSTYKRTIYRTSSSQSYMVKGQHVYLPLRNARNNAVSNLLPILHYIRVRAQDNNLSRSHHSSNISDLRLASTSWAAVSDLMVVLLVSNSREVSIRFQS